MNGVEANIEALVRAGAYPQWAADEAKAVFVALRDTVVPLMPYWGNDAMSLAYKSGTLDRFVALFDSMATLLPATQSLADGVRLMAEAWRSTEEEAAEAAKGIVPTHLPTVRR